jgi:hypothetical protein
LVAAIERSSGTGTKKLGNIIVVYFSISIINNEKNDIHMSEIYKITGMYPSSFEA